MPFSSPEQQRALAVAINRMEIPEIKYDRKYARWRQKQLEAFGRLLDRIPNPTVGWFDITVTYHGPEEIGQQLMPYEDRQIQL